MTFHRAIFLLPAVAMLALAACASGSAIVTGNTRDPVAPQQVKIYLEPPSAFEVIGVVDAWSDAGLTEQKSMDYAIEELKKQAARLGANGVLLVSSGESMNAVLGGSAKKVQGKAIFVSAR